MPIPPFVAELRSLVGTRELWLPGVTAVVRRVAAAGEEQLLLTLRADNGRWAPVCGIVDPGEEPAAAARREALEETGVEVRVDRLARVGVTPTSVYDNGDRSVYLDLTFSCTWVSGEARVADDENTDVRWWPVTGLPDMEPDLRSRVDVVLADEAAARFAV
ncbi:NUDIX domain-containing protein [Nocardioides ferulae]|uniref:NUDIX domain-containing protein n=1 Tax=Nocardioides ferulae TaxID=2340821 RepID=UPI000EABF1DE|nr:NUDIX domain-containing protein [Nocardioides ferulae]